MASTSASTSQVLPGQPLPAHASSAVPTAGAGVYQRGPALLSSLIGQASYTKSGTGKKGPSIAQVATPLSPLHRLPEPDSLVLARVTKLSPRQATCSILLVLPDASSSSSSANANASATASGPPVPPSSLSQSLASGAANHAAGEDPAGLDYSGVIRQQDVRLTETDKVRMGECFRPGDLVKARVVSLGDSRSYYLTTASNELGVVFAMAQSSAEVLPSSVVGRVVLPSRFKGDEETPQQQQQEGAIPGAMQPLNWQEVVDPLTGIREKRKVAKPEGL